MPRDLVIRPVLPHECQQVVSVHRAAFSPGQLTRSIFASSKVDRYLANLVACPQLQREHSLWAIWDGDRLVGYTHSRALPDTWHLNYIAVLPEYQSRGIGTMLWEHWVGAARQMTYSSVSLDVDDENRRAVDWYQRRGMGVVTTTWMYEKATRPWAESHRAAETATLVDWAEAEAWQLAYGFSRFRLAWGQRTWTVGRLASHYFRVEEELPGLLEGVLAEIDPERRLLILSPAPLQSEGLAELGVSYRMRLDVSYEGS